jgi:ribonuclease HI
MKIKEIYIDGASRGNPGNASYAVILKLEDGTTAKRGEAFTFKTNNQMEMLAAAKALFFITQARECGDIEEDYQVPIYTDSMLVCNMFIKGWMYRWEKRGTVDNHPNNDLIWMMLTQSYKAGKFKFIWVRGHADNPGNIEADKYCNEILNKYVQERR